MPKSLCEINQVSKRLAQVVRTRLATELSPVNSKSLQTITSPFPIFSHPFLSSPPKHSLTIHIILKGHQSQLAPLAQIFQIVNHQIINFFISLRSLAKSAFEYSLFPYPSTLSCPIHLYISLVADRQSQSRNNNLLLREEAFPFSLSHFN